MRSKHNSWCWMPVLLVCAASALAQQSSRICINEFLASNNAALADAEGRYGDWIELYNAGASAVDVGGMFLTDDIEEPTRWQMPTDRPDLTVIPAGGYALIWADGGADGAGLHASLGLSRDGEEIALFDTDGATLVDWVTFGEQTVDVSFGRHPDGASDWALMTTPTPGAANAPAYAGTVDEVAFSVEHGFFHEPFTVVLATGTADAQIWYTLDCTAPRGNADGPLNGAIYDRPIEIDGTTVIRAVAVRPGWKDSVLSARTYVFFRDAQWQVYNASQEVFTLAGQDEARTDTSQASGDEPVDPNLEAAFQALPSVCLVIEPNDFFDSETGINANAMRRGIEWERPVSVEWIDPNDRLSFQVNAGMRIHGGISRAGGSRARGPTKHSLRLLFKSQYGPSTLEAPLFGDTDVAEFDSLVLRCTYSDSWTGSAVPQYIRDQFARETMGDMGRLTPHGRPVHVYLNGFYWGLYILVERPDDGFAAAHLGDGKDQYDVLKPKSVGDRGTEMMEVVGGDTETWDALFALAEAGFEEQASYELARDYVDLPAMIDYMLMIFYIGSIDGPLGLHSEEPRNFWAIRPRAPGGGFVFLAWDLELCLRELDENRVTAVGIDNPHYLFHRLAAHPDFRMLVADRIYQRFFHDGMLTVPRVIERYRPRAAEVERAMLPEALRWSASTEPRIIDNMLGRWREERDRLIETYFPARGDIVVGQLREAGFYPAIAPPRLELDGLEQHGGATDAGASLALVNPNAGGTIYYTTDGTDPRTFGQGAVGVTAGQVASSAQPYSAPIRLTHSQQIKTRVWDDGLWSPLADAVFAVGPVKDSLRITEIMYHPRQADEEFIELANIGTEPLNLNMVRVAGGIDFVFSPLELAGGEVTVIVRDREAFEARYGAELNVAGQYEGALSNAGECVEVRDAMGRTIQEIRYDDDWYPQTDGQGYSLTCRDPWTQDANASSDADSWRPSSQIGGSPGRLADL